MINNNINNNNDDDFIQRDVFVIHGDMYYFAKDWSGKTKLAFKSIERITQVANVRVLEPVYTDDKKMTFSTIIDDIVTTISANTPSYISMADPTTKLNKKQEQEQRRREGKDESSIPDGKFTIEDITPESTKRRLYASYLRVCSGVNI